jgi:hypothetical protein
MVTGLVHIVGAGVAGLSCAVELAASGTPVTLYEAAGTAGGRCRSWHDAVLDRTIDNGNHLLLSGNSAALEYLRRIGAADELAGPPEAVLPFLDLATGERWALRPNGGRIPWWLFAPLRRVPGAGAVVHLRGLAALARAPAEATVVDALGRNALYRRLWEPLAVAVTNTPAANASARLLWRAVAETLGGGGQACRPLVAGNGLGAAFVDPSAKGCAPSPRKASACPSCTSPTRMCRSRRVMRRCWRSRPGRRRRSCRTSRHRTGTMPSSTPISFCRKR